MDGTFVDGTDSLLTRVVYVKERVLAALVYLKKMSHGFKLFTNVALQNQHAVPVGNCSCLKQQFGVF
jgi:hypothetical protein